MVEKFERKPELRQEEGEREPTPFGVVGIFTSPEKGEPMIEHQSVTVITGEGIEGDRYAERIGLFSKTKSMPEDESQITLISLQGINEANDELMSQGNKPFSMDETRRNIIVLISPEELNSLIGQKFKLGDIEMEGTIKCDPCTRPDKLSGKKNFKTAFENRGGLRAKILNNGEIKTGDPLVVSRING